RNLTAKSAERNDSVVGHCRESCRNRPVVQKEYWNLTTGSRWIESRRVNVLLQQHRKVLGYGVSEVRTEHADVIAAPVSHSDDGLWCDLVRNTQARSKRFVVVVDVTVQSDVPEASHTNRASSV